MSQGDADNILLVTGGSRGIGAATARLAARAATPSASTTDRASDAADAVVDAIVAAGGRAIAVQADVAVEADVVRLFEACDRALGPLTALVNNAGVLETQMRVDAMDAAPHGRACSPPTSSELPLRARGGATHVHAARRARRRDRQPVVRAARLGAPGEYVDYAASKGAVDTMTIGLAQEVRQEGIRVNAVRAGDIYTEIHASGGEPGPGRSGEGVRADAARRRARRSGAGRRCGCCRTKRPTPPARSSTSAAAADRGHRRAACRPRRGRSGFFAHGRDQRTREVTLRVFPDPSRCRVLRGRQSFSQRQRRGVQHDVPAADAAQRPADALLDEVARIGRRRRDERQAVEERASPVSLSCSARAANSANDARFTNSRVLRRPLSTLRHACGVRSKRWNVRCRRWPSCRSRASSDPSAPASRVPGRRRTRPACAPRTSRSSHNGSARSWSHAQRLPEPPDVHDRGAEDLVRDDGVAGHAVAIRFGAALLQPGERGLDVGDGIDGVAIGCLRAEVLAIGVAYDASSSSQW